MLAWVLGTPFPAPPAQVWLALHSGAVPALGNELKGWAGGDRLKVSAADFTAPASAGASGRERRNSRALLLGAASGDQSAMSFGLWDSASGGNLILAGVIANGTAVIKAGDPPVFLTGDLSLTVL